MRTKWTVDKTLQIVSTTRADRLRNLRALSDCVLTGKWVDVLTGRVIVRDVDLELPGPTGLSFIRYYSSAWAHRKLSLGYGWSHSYDQAIWSEMDRVVCRVADGREIELDCSHFPDGVVPRGGTLRAPFEEMTVTCVAPGFWKIESNYGPTLHFDRVPGDVDGVSRLVAIRSLAGPETRVAYNSRAQIERVIEPYGLDLTFQHNEKGHLESIVLSHPHSGRHREVATFKVSANDELLAVSDALKKKLHYEYVGGLLVRRGDRTGCSIYYGYDGIGTDSRCIRTWADGAAHDRKLSYKPEKNNTTVTDSVGRKLRYAGDPVHNLVSLRGVVRFVYDEQLRLCKKIDASGYVTRFEYDENGRLIKAVEPDGATWSMNHDARGRLAKIEAPNGATWVWSWDICNQVKNVKDPVGGLIDFDLDAGRLKKIELEGSSPMEFSYDSSGALHRLRISDEAQLHYENDWLRRPTKVVDSEGVAIERTYDTLGRLIEEKDSKGREITFEYDEAGRLLAFYDDAGPTKFFYDKAGYLVTRRGPEGACNFSYDTEGRLLSVSDNNNRIWTFERDKLGRVTTEVTVMGATWEYRYERNSGRIKTVMAPDRTVYELAYDMKGRVRTITSSDGLHEELQRDAAGRIIKAKSSTSEVVFDRDVLGRIEREKQDEHWVVSCWDQQGRRNEVYSSLGARQSFVYGDRWLEEVLMGEAHNSGRRWHMDLEPDEPAKNPPSFVPQKTLEGPRFQVQCDDDGVSHVVNRSSHRSIVDFLHDSYDHLTQLIGTDRTCLAFGEVNDVNDRRATLDEAGRIVEWNEPGRGVWKFSYCGWRLKKVKLPNGKHINYEYDGLGRRTLKQNGETAVRWLWNGSALLHEIHSDAPLTTWCFEPSGAAALGKLESGRYCELVDRGKGKVLAVIDDEGRELWRVELNKPGRPRVMGQVTAWPWFGEGLYRDWETSLLHGVEGDYFPAARCWLASPPWGLAAFGQHRLHGDSHPWSMALALRVSDNGLEAFLEAMNNPPSLRSDLEDFKDLSLLLPTAHPGYKFDRHTALPRIITLAEHWDVKQFL